MVRFFSFLATDAFFMKNSMVGSNYKSIVNKGVQLHILSWYDFDIYIDWI